MHRSTLTLCIILLLSASALAAESNRLGSNKNMRQLSISWPWSTTIKKYQLFYDSVGGNYMLGARFADTGATVPSADVRFMLPSLSNSDNLVFNNEDTGFKSYANFGFTQTSTATVSFEDPYFSGTGNAGTAVIQVPAMDGSVMSVGSPQLNSNYNSGNVLRVESVTSVADTSFGQSAYGYLGLTVTNLAANGQGTTFSIYLDKLNRNNSLLIFDKDLSYSRDVFASAKWTTNGSFVTTSAVQVAVGKTTVATSGTYNVIFDVNVNVTGLPTAVFTSLLTTLASSGVYGCTTDLSQPTCNYNGKIRDLPTIFLKNIGSSAETIAIPPKVYVAATKEFNGIVSQVVLNFKALSSTGSSPNAVSNTNHDTDIILDASIMAHYLTVFETDGANGQISLYVASGSTKWWFYYGWARWAKITTWVVVIIFAVFCIIGCICKRRRQRALAAAAAQE